MKNMIFLTRDRHYKWYKDIVVKNWVTIFIFTLERRRRKEERRQKIARSKKIEGKGSSLHEICRYDRTPVFYSEMGVHQSSNTSLPKSGPPVMNTVGGGAVRQATLQFYFWKYWILVFLRAIFHFLRIFYCYKSLYIRSNPKYHHFKRDVPPLISSCVTSVGA